VRRIGREAEPQIRHSVAQPQSRRAPQATDRRPTAGDAQRETSREEHVMLKKIALALVLIVLAFAGYVAIQPAVGTITRSATLVAPPSAVFPYLNDLHKWQEWSPWAKLDPDAKTTFEGPTSGVGAAFAWAGNHEIGEGKMTIVESQPDTAVKMKLNFAKPFASQSTAEFTLKPEGTGTNVTWSMTGRRHFLQRAMCVLFNADKMVGGMFEKGLTRLGEVSAAAPKP
jgi:uncharacterized protein YndB with AHSA1/START domain